MLAQFRSDVGPRSGITLRGDQAANKPPVNYVEGSWTDRAIGDKVGSGCIVYVHLAVHANADVQQLWDTLHDEEGVLGLCVQWHVLLR